MADNFGNNIKKLLKKKNLSVSRFAKDINTAQKTVDDWIKHPDRIPRDTKTLKRISEYFDCSVHWLLFGEDDPTNFISNILEKTEIHTGLYEISIKKVKTK